MGYAKIMRERKRAGSALIMVMLVVAGITTIIFATQRIALVQFSQSVREEDNLSAYYAAKAGIEDGLARYRFERNTQTSAEMKFRFNLTTGAFPSDEGYEIPSDTDIEEGINGDYDPDDQYYDMVVNYKTKSINTVDSEGEFAFSATNDILKKDEVITLTGFPYTETDYFLRYGFRFDPSCDSGDLDKAFVALQQVRTDTEGVEVTSQDIANYSNPTVINGVYDSRRTGTNMRVGADNFSVSSIRVRAFFCDVEFAFITTDTNDGATFSEDTPEFDGLTTEVLSTGYYGSAKRTLIAQVNRQTGELIGVFDFILYAGGNTGTIRQGF